MNCFGGVTIFGSLDEMIRRPVRSKSALNRYARPLTFEPLEDRRLLAVTGDYSANHVVDAADYVLWRKSAGSTGAQPADGNGDLIVNDADRDIWRQNFGQGELPGPFRITTEFIQDGELSAEYSWEPSAN